MQVIDVAPDASGVALVVHGGAGERVREYTEAERRPFEQALTRAYAAGRAVLDAGGSALDAVCAAVVVCEDSPQFNSGHGAALNTEGEAELDAAVMTGGRAGAVAASRIARNPVLAARAVMERTPHVLMVAPDAETVASWGLAAAEPSYFVTEHRQRELAEVLASRRPPVAHGTVGAVARDASGRLAAATSTGGVTAKLEGRIGDTPIIGAGTFASEGGVAVSCTGLGEAFISGVVAHEIAARVRYGGQPLPEAVRTTLDAEVVARDAFGGVIAVDASGRSVVAYAASSMLAAYTADGVVHTLT